MIINVGLLFLWICGWRMWLFIAWGPFSQLYFYINYCTKFNQNFPPDIFGWDNNTEVTSVEKSSKTFFFINVCIPFFGRYVLKSWGWRRYIFIGRGLGSQIYTSGRLKLLHLGYKTESGESRQYILAVGLTKVTFPSLHPWLCLILATLHF